LLLEATGAKAPGIGDPETGMDVDTSVETDTMIIQTTATRNTGAARRDGIRTGGVERVDGAMAEMIPVGAPTDMTGNTPVDDLGDMPTETTLAAGQNATIRDGEETGAGQQIGGIAVEGELRLVPIPPENLA
jgi:hypothetical protein